MTSTISTTLTEVAVYVGGFVSTRTGTVDLAKGSNVVSIAGATSRTRDESIRLRFEKGVTQGRIRMVEEPPARAQATEEDVAALNAARELDDAIAETTSEIEICDTELALWKKNGEFSYAKGVGPADAVGYMEGLAERLRLLQRRKRELEKTLRRQRLELEEHLRRNGIRRRNPWDGASAPDKTYAAVRGAVPDADTDEFVTERSRDARYVLAELWADQAGSYPFELQFWQDGATWEPLYELSADVAAGSVDLRLRAHVTQTTKEDWQQVRLRLCTGNPSVTGHVPALQPWYVDLRRNASPSRYAKEPRSMQLPNAGGAFGLKTMLASQEEAPTGEFEPVLERADVFEADRSDRKTMVEYALPGLWDIASGVDGQIVDLERRPFPAEFHCLAFPAADDAVYLSAAVADVSGAFPLDGEASTYVEGMFAGSFAIDAEKVSEPDFELPFGRSEQVRAQRTETMRRTTSVPLRNLAKTAYAFEIALRNDADEAVDVIVIDQVPVARDSSISVDVGRLDGGSVDEQTGEVRWEVRLAPGERRTLALEYAVSYPKREAVTGLSAPDYAAQGGAVPPRARSRGRSPGGFCPECGSAVDRGSAFCLRCGARL